MDQILGSMPRDPSKVREHPEGSEGSPKRDEKEKAPAPKKEESSASLDENAQPNINVLVVYTSKVKDHHLDDGGTDLTPEFVEFELIAKANAAFSHSNLPVRFILAGVMEVDGFESSGDVLNDIGHLENPSDGVLDDVHQWRNSTDADVVVLLIEEADAAGIAAEINATAQEAFVLMDDEYSWYYTFAHEIGHLLGCWHNPEAHSRQNPHFTFGHGFNNHTWRTIMSYDSGCGCNRIGLWSSPALKYPEGPAGTPAGTLEKHDNRRVWLTRAATVAAFR